MNITTVTQGITRITANVENILFEGFWELPDGVSLNSYIVQGDKTAIIDGMINFNDLSAAFKRALDKIDVSLENADYLIVNHMEPDHSGWIETIESLKPDAKVVCTQKAAALLDAFFGHKDNIMIVKDGDTLDLGADRVLTFHEIPNIHWPETMATFDTLSGTLFPCDAFGSYGKVYENGYDDLLNEDELKKYEAEAARYYSNIIATFSTFMTKAIDKLKELPIKIIAPGHGIVWRKNPERIFDDYARYASYQKGPCKPEITLLWGSMYGMTRRAVDHIIDSFDDSDIKLHILNVVSESISDILSLVWQSTGVILAMPTYEYKMFPPMASALEEICRKKAQNKLAFRIGSYGWSGGAQRELDEIIERNRANWSFIEPVEFNGSATNEDFKLIEERTKELIALVKKATE